MVHILLQVSDVDKTTTEIKEGGGNQSLSANAVFTDETKTVKVGGGITLLYRQLVNGVFGRKGLYVNTGYFDESDNKWYLDRPDEGEITLPSETITVKQDGSKTVKPTYQIRSLSFGEAKDYGISMQFSKDEVSPEEKHNIGFDSSDVINITVETGGNNVDAETAEISLTTQGYTITSGKLADTFTATSRVEDGYIYFVVYQTASFHDNLTITPHDVTSSDGSHNGISLAGITDPSSYGFEVRLLDSVGAEIKQVRASDSKIMNPWRKNSSLTLYLTQAYQGDSSVSDYPVEVTFSIKDKTASIIKGKLLEGATYSLDTSGDTYVLNLDYSKSIADVHKAQNNDSCYVQVELQSADGVPFWANTSDETAYWGK